MSKLKIKLSALDQSSLVGTGKTFVQALEETTELTKVADRLNFTRYWVSEHHNSRLTAGTAPEILIAHLAVQTKNIKVGAGGIMLPNHAPLKVAESFKLLEALYPNRIDLGLGRAAETDVLTATILNPPSKYSENDFVQQLNSLEKFLNNADDKGTIFERIKAYPFTPSLPERWLLSSSGDSAMLAAKLGYPLSYAHFISPNKGKEILDIYEENFIPNSEGGKPKSNVAIFAFCSENEELVKQQQAIMDYRFIATERGIFNYEPVSYKDIKDEEYSEFEQKRILVNRERYIYDTPVEMKKRLDDFILSTGTEELMLVTYADKLEDRIISLELIANMFDII